MKVHKLLNLKELFAKLQGPVEVILELTGICNLKCIHCYVQKNNASRELTKDELRTLIQDMRNLGVQQVVLGGGEPLLHKDIFEIVKTISKNDMHASIASNGFLLDEKTAVKLRESGLERVTVSIDSVTPGVHNAIRRHKGAFTKAVKALQTSLKYGFETGICMTLMKINLREALNIVNFCLERGVDYCIFNRFIPLKNDKITTSLEPNLQERKQILNVLVALKQRLKDRLEIEFCGEPLLHLYDYGVGCMAGIWCGITASGDVLACPFLPISLGNIKEGFEHVWGRSRILKKLKNADYLKGRCGNCPYKQSCRGCRATAYAYFRDYLQEDPYCDLPADFLGII